MQLINKYAVALVASLAAVGEAEHHGLHARLFNPRGYNGTFPSSSSSLVASSPISSSVAVSSSKVISTPVSIPYTTSGGGASTTDVTLTYTVGTGTSTRMFTTTIHSTATDEHTVYAVSVSTRGHRYQYPGLIVSD